MYNLNMPQPPTKLYTVFAALMLFLLLITFFMLFKVRAQSVESGPAPISKGLR